jgi:serine/threonine protein kinase
METRFLSSLEHHPNVVKLRAIVKGDCFYKDYFIVLDRLFDTLTKHLETWKKENKTMQGLAGIVRDRKGKNRGILVDEHMFFAYDLSLAIAHLHLHGIIHRDLKQDNLG